MPTRRDLLLGTVAGVASMARTPLAAAGTRKIAAASDRTTAMATYRILHTDLVVSRLAYGGGSLGGAWVQESASEQTIANAERLIHTAYDNGITLFDMADVYAFGKSEAALGEVLKRSPGLRDKIAIQTKCGIHISLPIADPPAGDPHVFDFSYGHIISAAEGSLRRLGTDRLDVLLLHRPDALGEPQEVARAFEELHRGGKVRYFGVSNHTSAQIELLKKVVRQPLVINQIAIGLAHPDLITDGLDFNREGATRLIQAYTGVAGTLDYCRLHDIQVQAYSPVRGLSNTEATPAIRQTLQLLKDMAHQKNTTPFALALAWLMRHPAGIVPVLGGDNPDHLVEDCAAERIEVTRQEWYALLYAATGMSGSRIL
jgi:predicted oxidoreductase